MVLQIGKLQIENNKWMIVYPDGSKDYLEDELDCNTVFIEHEQWWEEVYCGEVFVYEGEINGQPYKGPAIELICGGKGTGRIVALPGAVLGKWFAFKWFETDVYWALEPGMLIRTPIGTGDYVAGTYAKAPRGKCVCTVIIADESRGLTIGRIAMDLATLPFPRRMWFYDADAFQESELVLSWGTDDVQLTREMFGKLDSDALFWL